MNAAKQKLHRQINFVILSICFIAIIILLFRYFVTGTNRPGNQADFILLESIRFTNYLSAGSISRLTDRFDAIQEGIGQLQGITESIRNIKQQFNDNYKRLEQQYNNIQAGIANAQKITGKFSGINQAIREEVNRIRESAGLESLDSN